jgi:pimeloyl-ACP methyl ester carboxylesterase
MGRAPLDEGPSEQSSALPIAMAGEATPLEPGASSTIVWRPCGELECAEVLVPLDPSDPAGEQLPIALNRRAPAPGTPNLGVLLFNPGGPGASGKAYVANTPAFGELPFDVIGFDPRGVGDSRALDCTLPDSVALFEAEGVGAVVAAHRAAGERCREATGPLFDHLSTNAVVADIEQIRIALGVEKINFYGVSYGTRIGAAYAQRHPERVRALVLDAPMPPTADLPELVDVQFDALLSSHQALIAGCEQGQLPCPVEAAELFEKVVGAFEQVGLRDGFLGLWAAQLITPPGRDMLTTILTQAALSTQDEIAQALAAGPMMPMMSAPMLGVPDIVASTNVTVHCSDSSVDPPSESEAEAMMASFEARSARFARFGLPALSCMGWPAARDPLPPITSSLSTPTLILAGVADRLTPLPLAQELHAAVPASGLLVSEHYGHGALIFGGECVETVFGHYLGSLELPLEGTVCPAP